MPANGTATFFNSSDYQAGFRGGTINLVFTGPGIFTARLTTVSLPHLRLYSVQESLPRIAYVALAPNSVNFAFPILPNTSLVWGTFKMTPRDLIFHSIGERMHQCTTGASGWSVISVDRKFFAGSSRALVGSEISPPRVAGCYARRPMTRLNCTGSTRKRVASLKRIPNYQASGSRQSYRTRYHLLAHQLPNGRRRA